MRSRLLVLTALGLALVPAFALAGGAKTIVLKASLTGAAEIPPGDVNGNGSVTIRLKSETKVCWAFAGLKKIGKPTAAHIHKGKPGQVGPVVIPLGAAFAAKGCTSANASVVTDLRKNPGNYYVNVHNAEFPDGAIRGPLRFGGEDQGDN